MITVTATRIEFVLMPFKINNTNPQILKPIPIAWVTALKISLIICSLCVMFSLLHPWYLNYTTSRFKF